MFHVNALGHALRRDDERREAGLPGPHLDGASLHELFEAERVTLSLGVPTVWLGLLTHLDATAARVLDACARPGRRRGGAAVADRDVRRAYGVASIQGWGMTEMSPVGTLATLKAEACRRSTADAELQRRQARSRAGRCSASR